jgi:hypothetical protein
MLELVSLSGSSPSWKMPRTTATREHAAVAHHANPARENVA